MGRILALDYGRKRVGIAVTDPLQMIAGPLDTVASSEIEKFLVEYCRAENVGEIVVGYPRQMNNEPSEAVKYIDPFLARLKKLLPEVPVYLADERFTSAIAKRSMIEGGMKKGARRDKSVADKVSASLILQSFLEQRKFLRKDGAK